MSDLLLEYLQAASRDDWSKALGFLCRAACTAASAPSAAVFAWPNGAPRCLASYQVDPPSVEELARRAGKVGPAHQLGPYQVFPLLMAGHLDAGFLLESRAPLEPLEQSIGAILETTKSACRVSETSNAGFSLAASGRWGSIRRRSGRGGRANKSRPESRYTPPVSSRAALVAGCFLGIAACQGSKVEKEQIPDADEPASAGESPGGTPTVFANIEGRPLQFRYGKAYATSDTLHIVLSTEKTACTFAPGTEDAYRIRFELTPGPGGRFFTGTPTGVGANFESRRTRLAITAADPYLVTATVDPFVLKGGSHIRGRLEFDVKFVKTKVDRSKQAYQSKGAGYFDVEICDDAAVLKALKGQPQEVPDGEVAGSFAGQKFVFKTAIANVWHDPDNAQDYIDSIVFFPIGGITCANQWEQRDKVNLFMIRSIGGAGSRQRFTGSPQPASASFFIPKLVGDGNDATDSIYFFGGGAERAWVRFDKLDFKAGANLTGAVYADSREGSKIEEEGRIGGRFRAKVCTAD